MQNLGLFWEALKAATAVFSLAEEFAVNESESIVTTFVDDDSGASLNTCVNTQLENQLALQSAGETAASEALQKISEAATGLSLTNPAEGVAESEEELASELSEYEYETVNSLQSALRTMMQTHKQECPCGNR